MREAVDDCQHVEQVGDPRCAKCGRIPDAPRARRPKRPHLADRWQALGFSRLNGGLAAAGTARRKLCIYGAGLLNQYAPLNDADWEIWTCNLIAPRDATGHLRADAWFDLHQREAQTADDLRWIAACPVPIYLPPDLMDASPRAVAYPLQAIEQRFRTRYWTCTFAYQIALALYQNAESLREWGSPRWTDLGLYGVELAYGTARERTVEWACVAYWLGRAQEQGVRVHVPQGSCLGQHVARYGFEYRRELDAVKDYTQLLDWDPDSPTALAPIDGAIS